MYGVVKEQITSGYHLIQWWAMGWGPKEGLTECLKQKLE